MSVTGADESFGERIPSCSCGSDVTLQTNQMSFLDYTSVSFLKIKQESGGSPSSCKTEDRVPR